MELANYRGGLKSALRVPWIWGGKLRFPACCRKKNAIFYIILTEPGAPTLAPLCIEERLVSWRERRRGSEIRLEPTPLSSPMPPRREEGSCLSVPLVLNKTSIWRSPISLRQREEYMYLIKSTSWSFILLETYHDSLSLTWQEIETWTSNPVENPLVKGTNFSFLSSSLSSLPIVLRVHCSFHVHDASAIPPFRKDEILPTWPQTASWDKCPPAISCPREQWKSWKVPARSVEDGVDDRQLFVRPDFGVRMIFLPSLSSVGRSTQTLGGIRWALKSNFDTGDNRSRGMGYVNLQRFWVGNGLSAHE